MESISPKYQMELVNKLNDGLFNAYKSYAMVEEYIKKWQQIEYCNNYDQHFNFDIIYKESQQKKIDVIKTLHGVDSETLLKMAIDMGIETPDYIPCIPTFKNDLKSSFETASQTFEKAFNNVEKEPSLAISLANSTLESIMKEILEDSPLCQDSCRKEKNIAQ